LDHCPMEKCTQTTVLRVTWSHGEDSGNSATRPNRLAPEKGPISPDMGRLMAAIGPDSNVRQKTL